jgi:hypothetical protein
MANALNQQAESGHLCRILARTANGTVPIGWARSASNPQSFGTEGAYVIGSIMPQEHVAQRWSSQITINSFRIRKSDLRSLGIIGYGEEIETLPLLDFEILDKVTGQVIRIMEGCTPTSNNYQITANAFSGEDISFEALNVRAGA